MSSTYRVVVLGLLVPLFRIPHDAEGLELREGEREGDECNSQILLNGRWLSELGSRRAIQVVANHPRPSLVQSLPFLLLACSTPIALTQHHSARHQEGRGQ